MKKKTISLGILILNDFVVVLVCYFLAYGLRSEILPLLFEKFKAVPLRPFSYFLDHFYMASVWIFIFAYEKLYTKRYAFWNEVKVLMKSATLASSLIMIFIFITRSQNLFSRTTVVLAWLLSLLLFPVSRYLTKHLLIRFNLWKKKLIILGVHQTSLLVVQNIKKNVTMGYEILGFLDDDPLKNGRNFHGVKVLGPFSQLASISNQYKSKDVMIATPHLPRKQLRELLSTCEDICESMWLIPRSGDFITEGVEIDILGEVLTLYRKKNLAKPWNILIKSLFERSLTLVLLILLLPLFAVIAVAIKLDSKGSVIFIQKRLGRGKKMFDLYKFRSMYVDGDDKLKDFLQSNSQAQAEWTEYRKLKNHDPRVTRVGKIIRRYSLDELPQLFNVILGNMSLVGPRPYLISELEGKDAFITLVAKVKPGITGFWQISGRSELPFERRLANDEYYIRNWSLWLDLMILVKSVKVLFSSKGAY